ncbi:hypothetical protein [Microbispora hainanensis]|uniref:ATP/GTP-binding protein n=1 Tax=Microbispora hainanensis TaxID=568844 RepID=A0ABZ1SN25_9ACTN|nr:hypothetical protein [Microbispora hainanensis]
MFSRILIASVLPAVSMLTPSPPLDNNAVQTSPLGYLLTADKDPHSGQQVTSASAAHRESGVTCSYTPWHADGMKNGGLEWVDPASSPGGVPKGKGAYYLVECSDGFRDVRWIPDHAPGAPRVTPAQLARKAWAMIPVREPKVLTAPPRGSTGLVGLDEWVYLAKGEWSPKRKRVETAGVWAQATARPQKMTVDPGDGGKPVTCQGPGTSYNPELPASRQKPTCAVRYLQPSLRQGQGNAYRVTVTVTWSGTWTGSGGTGGTLPPITRSTSFPLRVAEAQALITKD